VTGRVVDKAGQLLLKGTVVLWKDGRGTPSPFIDGRYAVSLSNPGKYRVELKGPGFSKSSQEIQAEPGQIYRLNFTLQPGGVIKGRVVDAGGRPLQDGDVFYQDGAASFGVPIDPDGTYRIEGLAPGQYKVSVISGENKVSQNVQVDAGKESVLDFVLK
jgi:hypothetical protein